MNKITEDFPSLKNHFLIAMPDLQDPSFYQSVTYIIEHDAEGAMGMIINHPLDFDLNELFVHLNMPFHKPQTLESDQAFLGHQKVIAGGPVQTERGFIIHSPKGDWDSTMNIDEGISVTTSQDILKAIAKNEGPSDVEIILGYSGWDAGQLDREILENSWLSVKATPEILFNTPHDKRWKAAAQLIGIDINQLSTAIGHG